MNTTAERVRWNQRCLYPHVREDDCPGCADASAAPTDLAAADVRPAEPDREEQTWITLLADNPTHPYLVRAYRARSLVGYAIRDGYGWAIVGLRQGRMRTVDRNDWVPGLNEQPEAELREFAVAGLFRFAVTGSTGDGFWDLPYQRGAS